MKNKGFSLVELIVVIAIMAILVGVAVPVYTSYIGKANEAKDIQLLGEINSAFMVAAVDNQVDFDALTPENNKIEIGDGGTIDFEGLYGDLEDTVTTIISGDLKFNTITSLYYNPVTREFGTTVVASYGGGYVMMNPEDIKNFKGSNFITWGVSNILGNVDNAVVTLEGLTSGSLYELVYDGNDIFGWSPTTKETIGSMLGLDLNDEDDATKYLAIAMKKAEMIAIANGDSAENAENYLDQANKEIAANATVLSVSSGSTFDADAYAEKLANGQGIVDVKDNLNEYGEKEQLAKIAMAYAMYTSYQTYLGNPISDEPDVNEVRKCIEGVEDDGFFKYMKTEQAATDLQGYMSAMNMINDSAKDPTAVEQLLVNGFTDSELEGILTDALG